MLSHLRRYWFLSLLVLVLAFGLWLGTQLAAPVSHFPRAWLVAAVMFVTALPISFAQLAGAAGGRSAVGLALLLSMAVAPPLAYAIGWLLPESLATGLVVAACVPCTLASAAVWTRRGGGNDAIALLVTLVTNLLCFLVLPFWIKMLLGHTVEDNAAGLSLRLLLLVVLPVVAGQLLRRFATVQQLTARHKAKLSVVAQLGVLCMVFFGAVSAGDTLATIDSAGASWTIWLGLLVAVLALHLLLFSAGWFGSQAFGVRPADGLAAAIAGSQKTLMIGLDVAIGFGGLAILPMVAYHIVQLVVDTLLVEKLRVDPTVEV